MLHVRQTIALRWRDWPIWLASTCACALPGCHAMTATAPAALLRQRIDPPPARLALEDAEATVEDRPAEEVPTPSSSPGPELPKAAEGGGEPKKLDRLPPTDQTHLPADAHLQSAAETLPEPVPLMATKVELALPEPIALETAIEMATRSNPRLERLRERIAEASAGQTIARADFLPEAVGSYRHLNGGPREFILPTLMSEMGVVAPGGPSERFDRAELSVQWILFDFGRTSGRVGQAGMAADIARLQYQRGTETIAFEATAAYFAVLRAQAAMRIAEEGVASAKRVQRDARHFLERGTVVRNDVLRADVLVAEMQTQLVKARTERGAAVATLNQAMGINVSCPTRVIDRVEEPPFGLTLADALQLAADHRDEFAVALDAIRSSRMGVGMAKAEFLPRIVVGGVAVQQQDVGIDDYDQLLAGGVKLELAMFEGGRRVGQVRQAEAEVRGSIAQGKQMCDQIALEVNLAYLDISDARQRIGLSRASVAQASENFRVVQRLFQQGDATQTDVIDAVLIRTRAEQGLSQASYDYQLSLARLAYATGLPSTPGLAATLFAKS